MKCRNLIPKLKVVIVSTTNKIKYVSLYSYWLTAAYKKYFVSPFEECFSFCVTIFFHTECLLVEIKLCHVLRERMWEPNTVIH